MSLMLARRAVVRSPLRFSLAATDYLKRLDAEGARVRMFDKANANLIDALVELGGAYWDTAGTITTLCAKGFDGLTVPLRDGMNVGTPVAFEAGDLNVKTGLKGDGSSKYIDSNRNNNADGQNDFSMGFWATEIGSVDAYMGVGDGSANVGSSQIFVTSIDPNDIFVRNRGGTSASTTSPGSNATGYIGTARATASEITIRGNGTTSSHTFSSFTPTSGNLLVFRRTAGNYVSARIPLYHIGPALDLGTLDGILSNFMAEVAAV
jgi:hypothetical protein